MRNFLFALLLWIAHSLSVFSQVCNPSLQIQDAVLAIQGDQDFDVNSSYTYCIEAKLTFLPFVNNLGVNGTVAFADNTVNPPFSVTVDDGSTVQTLSGSGSVSITENTVYEVTIITGLDPGSAILEFTAEDVPSPLGGTIDITEEVEVRVIDAAAPVTWSAPLTYRSQKDRLHFDWSVSEERDVAHYELERSVTGSEFIAVDRLLPAAPNSNGEIFYRLFDVAQPADSYYRIRQEDLDGSFSYSNTILVPAYKTGFRVYPNPTSGSFQLAVASGAAVDIFDGLGRRVAGDWRSEMEGELTAGIYWIVVTNESGDRFTKRLIVR